MAERGGITHYFKNHVILAFFEPQQDPELGAQGGKGVFGEEIFSNLIMDPPIDSTSLLVSPLIQISNSNKLKLVG